MQCSRSRISRNARRPAHGQNHHNVLREKGVCLMEIKGRRFPRRGDATEQEPIGFQWVDVYPLIGLVSLAGYLILG